MYVYIYIYICMYLRSICIHTYIYIYICIYKYVSDMLLTKILVDIGFPTTNSSDVSRLLGLLP